MFVPGTQEAESAALVIRTHDDDRAVVEASTEEEEEEEEGAIARRAKATAAPNGRAACFPDATMIALEAAGIRDADLLDWVVFIYHRYRYSTYTK